MKRRVIAYFDGFNYYEGLRKKGWRNIECNGKKVGREIRFWEEKKSDVALASYMIRDVALNKCDTIFLFSADSDLTPALDIIQEIAAHLKQLRIIVFFPPGNYSHDLKNKANKVMHLENHEYKFKASQFPDIVTLPDGYRIKKPIKWR
jgi:uncharacterized LabA/DUF88 family protein